MKVAPLRFSVHHGRSYVKNRGATVEDKLGPLRMASAGIGLLPGLGVEIERAIRSHRLDRAFQRPVATEWFAPELLFGKDLHRPGHSRLAEAHSLKGRDEEVQPDQTRNRSTRERSGKRRDLHGRPCGLRA